MTKVPVTFIFWVYRLSLFIINRYVDFLQLKDVKECGLKHYLLRLIRCRISTSAKDQLRKEFLNSNDDNDRT